ncbi:MAG: ribosome biogenesis GTPase Der [Planctomycetota bacterium]
MPVPRVVIAGRPNVGKSSLFNMLAKSRIAIVDAMPGVTRDRLSKVLTHSGRAFELMDTGGIGIVDSQGLEKDVAVQIEIAFAEADLILLVVDARDGLLSADSDIALRLRALSRPIILVVNKADSPRESMAASDFAVLGFEEPVLTSAPAGAGRGALMDRIAEELSAVAESTTAAPFAGTRLAIVGKRNVGKSTLLNRLCGAERVIVSPIPGTTRDSIDVPFTHEGKDYVAIDTAGVRRERSVEGSVDFYGQARAHRAIRRADVVLFLIDAASEVSIVDKKLAEAIVSEFKPAILIVNKWDLVSDRAEAPEKYAAYLSDRLPGLDFAPIVCICAQTGWNVPRLLPLADELVGQTRERVTTGELNRIVNDAVGVRAPRPKHGKVGKIFYATQISVAPPAIVLFVNDPGLFDRSYLRYLSARLRRDAPYREVPVRLFLRPKGGRRTPSAGRS